jgi:hypothetical protein
MYNRFDESTRYSIIAGRILMVNLEGRRRKLTVVVQFFQTGMEEQTKKYEKANFTRSRSASQ